MDNTADQAWSRPEQVDPMAQLNTSLDDLGNLFEFGDIDLNTLPSVDTAQFDEHMRNAGTHPSTPFDELSEAQAISGTNAQDFGAHGHFGLQHSADQAQHQQRFNGHGQASNLYSSDQAFQSVMQQGFHPNQQFQFQGMPGFPSNQQIPPTPNSFEMHGETGRFLQSQLDSQQRAMIEQRFQLRKEDAIVFTPMVSPAGTPQHNVQPEFAIPSAYFSPLTSPMLHAQNSQHAQHHQHHQQGFYTNPSTAPSSNATSPLDPNLDVDMLVDEISLTEPADLKTRKTSSRRKVPTPRSAGPLARVKQSPIQKAVKRKSGTMLSSLPPPREGDANPELQRSKSAQPNPGGLSMPRNDSSENGSISPEPLSEALMGPPPRPASSKTSSPAIRAQKQAGNAGTVGAAATPKSLLSMRRAQTTDPASVGAEGVSGTDDMALEDLQLPASVADNTVPPRSLARLNTQLPSGDDTPRLSARKTPKLGPSSTPSSAIPASTAPSPSIAGSPMTASTPGALLKDRKDSKSGKGSRKRSSVSNGGSSVVSPALRPRISPSIKPLLPDGASLHSPNHALLLASKSNYQNLLEGNQLPGVSYPESLSTGLTSKRTSHKVAEQGRRNRINDALKEMQSLLPKPVVPKGKDTSNSEGSPEAGAEANGKDSKEDSVAKSNSSKAATVESANEYIRKLQKENAALLLLKKEHEEMKKKLDAGSGASSACSDGSDVVKSSSPIDAS